jgi:hypothetical protein
MKDVVLGKGAHPARFGGDGTITVCAAEFASYLAGLEHTDRPSCVSPALLAFMISWNDALDDETRQKLRPYISRTIGTAGDGQDERRSYMALDWLIRVHTPAFLEAARLVDHAEKLRSIAPIESSKSARRATSEVQAAGNAASAAARDAASAAARDAASDAANAAARDAASAAASDAASDAARDAASAAAWDTARAAASAAASDAASDAAWDTAWDTAWDALAPTVASLQESAFELLDRLIDPGGLHDVKTEAEYLAETVQR